MTEIFNNFGDIILNIFIMIFSFLFFGGVAFGVFKLFMRFKQYTEFLCIIWKNDAFGQLIEVTDGAGIFTDGKTKNKRFFLKKANVGLNPDNVPYVQRGNKRIVYLRQDGLKNFSFVRPVIHNQNVSLEVGEEDVNWAINAYERQKNIFAQNLLMQYLPFIILAFVSIVILIIFIYFFKNFGVLADAAVALKEAAQALAQAKSGTMVIQ